MDFCKQISGVLILQMPTIFLYDLETNLAQSGDYYIRVHSYLGSGDFDIEVELEQ